MSSGLCKSFIITADVKLESLLLAIGKHLIGQLRKGVYDVDRSETPQYPQDYIIDNKVRSIILMYFLISHFSLKYSGLSVDKIPMNYFRHIFFQLFLLSDSLFFARAFSMENSEKCAIDSVNCNTFLHQIITN